MGNSEGGLRKILGGGEVLVGRCVRKIIGNRGVVEGYVFLCVYEVLFFFLVVMFCIIICFELVKVVRNVIDE